MAMCAFEFPCLIGSPDWRRLAQPTRGERLPWNQWLAEEICWSSMASLLIAPSNNAMDRLTQGSCSKQEGSVIDTPLLEEHNRIAPPTASRITDMPAKGFKPMGTQRCDLMYKGVA